MQSLVIHTTDKFEQKEKVIPAFSQISKDQIKS